jgi:hypothetical protein
MSDMVIVNPMAYVSMQAKARGVLGGDICNL